MEKERCDVSKSCDSCEKERTCSSKEKEEHEEARLAQKLSHIRNKIMVMSGKGGVGKSTVAVNLAASLALQDYAVGILDADIHGPDIPRMCGVENRSLLGHDHGVTPVQVFKGLKAVSMGLLSQDPDKAIVWRGPLKHRAIKQFLGDVSWGELDYLVIDLLAALRADHTAHVFYNSQHRNIDESAKIHRFPGIQEGYILRGSHYDRAVHIFD